ncbi:MAG: NAD-binding protein [Salinirussus sp.]
MDWASRRQWLGTRAAILLPSVVAILSLATGLANITVRQATGPLAPIVPPEIAQAAGFTGTLTGFVLLMSVAALRRGYRVGWYATVGLIPVTAIQGLVQSSAFSLPLVILSLLSIPTVLLNFNRFDRSMPLSVAQLGAMTALGGTLIYGTVGSYALRESFDGIDTWVDAFYYTVVTASTVGYGDIAAESAQGRLFSVSLVVIGTASFALALGSVLGPAIEARLSRALGTMSDTNYHLLEDHVLVLGYGDLTEPLVEELAAHDVRFVVVTAEPETASGLRQQDIDVLTGDPSDERPLEEAGIGSARAVIAATEEDAEDAFSILTARELNPDIRIVAAATHRENVDKLRRAGADVVISPATIGGRMLVRSALGSEDVETIADTLLEAED